MNNSLAKVHPELVSEWSEKNLTLMPVTLRSVQIKNEIQQRCPTAMVFYGQDTGYKLQENHDELRVLLPVKEFEHNILHHLEQVDGIVLRCREEMIHRQARTRCRCKTNNKTAAMRKTHSSGFGLSAENQVQ